MILSSKTIGYTLAGASFLSAIFLVGLYGVSAPSHRVFAFETPVKAAISVIPPQQVMARAAIVYDPVSKQIIFEKNGDERLPLASLTKLMSADAVLAHESATTTVEITRDDLKPSGDWGLRVGDRWNLVDLVRFGLVASSNDAMAAAAGVLGDNGIDAMNHRAQELGLTQTYFFNPTGLDLDIETAGAYGSAHDVAILAAAFLAAHPALFEATVAPSVTIRSGTEILHATSTAGPLLDIPGLIGAKTGYTDLAGGNLVAAVDISVGHPLIIAVLGSTREGRFEDVKTLVGAAREVFGH